MLVHAGKVFNPSLQLYPSSLTLLFYVLHMFLYVIMLDLGCS